MNARQVRVAFDNSLTRDNLAGTGMYASHLLREMEAYPDLDVHVFNGPKLASSSKGYPARIMRALANRYWARFRFSEILRKGNFDLLHGPVFIIPLHCPCASVVTVYDLTFRLFPGHFEGQWSAHVASRLPSILRSVSAVICISEQTKQDLLKFYNMPSEKVHVVYCGIDHSRFHSGVHPPSIWAKAAGLRSGYVLHVGSLATRKNIPALLRAVALLRSKGKWDNRQIVLAGSKTRGLAGASEVYESIRKLGLSDVVILPGHVPDEHVPGLYANASMLVMPTLYEGFGLPILESMAVGTPVVASNNSSIPEVAGDAALLVPTGDEQAMADAIERILEDPSTAQQLRERGLIQAGKFSWQKMAAETVAIYRLVAKQ